MKTRLRKQDLFLIGGFVAAAVILALILLFTGQKGAQVQVRVSGKTVASFPLDQETVYEISGKDGGKNLLIIKDGSAWIEEADCPDRLCRNMGKINLQGQSVICLPHEVVVEIVDGTADMPDVDVIVE